MSSILSISISIIYAALVEKALAYGADPTLFSKAGSLEAIATKAELPEIAECLRNSIPVYDKGGTHALRIEREGERAVAVRFRGQARYPGSHEVLPRLQLR